MSAGLPGLVTKVQFVVALLFTLDSTYVLTRVAVHKDHYATMFFVIILNLLVYGYAAVAGLRLLYRRQLYVRLGSDEREQSELGRASFFETQKY